MNFIMFLPSILLLSIIGKHHCRICPLSVCLSVRLCIVTFRSVYKIHRNKRIGERSSYLYRAKGRRIVQTETRYTGFVLPARHRKIDIRRV